MVKTVRQLLGGLSLVAGLALAAGPAAAQAASDLQRIVSEKVVKAGAVEAFPYYKKDLQTGEWTGIMPDLMRLMFGSIGVKVEFVTTDWGTAAAGLQSKKFDLIGAYNATPQRALALGFSGPVAESRLAVVTLRGNADAYKSWSSLDKASVKVAAVDGAATTRAAQKLIPNATWTLVKSTDAMVLELESGRVDVMLSNEPTLALFKQSKGKGTIVVPEPVKAQPVNIGMRKDAQDLREWVDVALDYYKVDGSVKEIWEKYVKVN